ncbi:MAG: hypothetical protein ABSA46_06130 [Thermodesulfovibrionales bacterium]
MTTLTMSPAVIRKVGLEAVAKKLGPLGMVRFLQQFETGRGDYTKERDQWLKDADIKEIISEIRKKR